MFTTRTFSANIGDESVLNAGPDAIEQDIDHLLANDTEINNAKINKVDIVNDAVAGGATKVLSAEAGKNINNRIDTIVYSSVVNDLVTGGADVALSAEQGIVLLENQMASYMAFCTNANMDSLDAAFGKNNENEIKGIGRQLAMYAWFKGDSKVSYPFTSLLSKNSLSEINLDVSVLSNNFNIIDLIGASTYANLTINWGKLLVYIAGLAPADYADLAAVLASSTAMTAIVSSGLALKIICKIAYLTEQFKLAIQTYRSTIITTLNAATTLFAKTTPTYTSANQSMLILKSFVTNTNTIIIPKSFGAIDLSGTYAKNIYYGTDSTDVISTASSAGNVAQTVTSGVSMRGIHYNWTSGADFPRTLQLTGDTYTVR